MSKVRYYAQMGTIPGTFQDGKAPGTPMAKYLQTPAHPGNIPGWQGFRTPMSKYLPGPILGRQGPGAKLPGIVCPSQNSKAPCHGGVPTIQGKSWDGRDLHGRVSTDTWDSMPTPGPQGKVSTCWIACSSQGTSQDGPPWQSVNTYLGYYSHHRNDSAIPSRGWEVEYIHSTRFA